jgi:hypothetical protein
VGAVDRDYTVYCNMLFDTKKKLNKEPQVQHTNTATQEKKIISFKWNRVRSIKVAVR